MFAPSVGLAPFTQYNNFDRKKIRKNIYRDYKFQKKQVVAVKEKFPENVGIRKKHRNIQNDDPTFFNPEDDIQVRGPNVELKLAPEYFKECESLDDTLRKNLDKLGYEQLTHVQRILIPLIDCPDNIRHDVVLCGRTGSGKTLGYLIAAIQNAILKNKLSSNRDDADIQHHPSILIMVQSNHAAEQVFLWANLIASNTLVRIRSAIGAINRTDEIEKLDAFGADIMVATIGRLTDYLKTYPNLLKGVQLLIFDDAEVFLRDENWDNDGIEVLKSAIDGPYQVVCLSAGFDERSKDYVKKFAQENRWEIDIAALNKVEKRIPQEFIDLYRKDRTEILTAELLKRSVDNRYPKAIVFCNSIEIATMVSNRLRLDTKLRKGFRPRVAFLHGGTFDPSSVFDSFCIDKGEGTDLDGNDEIELDVVVACDGFAYGINAKVELVINFDFPSSLCIYAQRIGRAGRQGVKGKAITMIDSHMLRKNPAIFENNVFNILHAAAEANAMIPDSFKSLLQKNKTL